MATHPSHHPNRVLRGQDGHFYSNGGNIVLDNGSVLDLSQQTDGGVLGPTPNKRGIFVAAQQLIVSRYSFAVQGGVAGAIPVWGANKLPANFLIQRAWLNVIAAVTGAGASVAVGVVTTTDVINTAAISGAPWSTTGQKIGVPVPQTATTWILTTAAGDITVTVSAANLTAGLFDIYLEGYVIAIT